MSVCGHMSCVCVCVFAGIFALGDPLSFILPDPFHIVGIQVYKDVEFCKAKVNFLVQMCAVGPLLFCRRTCLFANFRAHTMSQTHSHPWTPWVKERKRKRNKFGIRFIQATKCPKDATPKIMKKLPTHRPSLLLGAMSPNPTVENVITASPRSQNVNV